MASDMPYSGRVRIKINSNGKKIKLKLRIPYWADADIRVSSEGYAVYEEVFEDKIIEFDLGIKIRRVYASPNVNEDNGKVAFMYGPLVLCAEGKDNPFNLYAVSVTDDAEPIVEVKGGDYIVSVKIPVEVARETEGLYNFEKPEITVKTLTLIPYHVWANRGENDMKVWFNAR